ncbi:MAG: superoxide dismutase [Patescibacteria group bacterium]|nr:superoxide dismutase [Patescibacteria group bacterium]MDE2172427.1 superoxide dismutase [Patescibacteria group bacterium]
MHTFTARKFIIPKLIGISEKTIEEHLKLYNGYVNNANTVLAKSRELAQDSDKNAYLLGELARRFSFEYNGMRNHEIYFSSFEGGPTSLAETSKLMKMITDAWGSFEAWQNEFRTIGLTRGIGWAVLWYDPTDKCLLNSWIDEQHLGQLQHCVMILGLDMWEHSYVADYQPAGKKNYIGDFLANVNWSVVEKRL